MALKSSLCTNLLNLIGDQQALSGAALTTDYKKFWKRKAPQY